MRYVDRAEDFVVDTLSSRSFATALLMLVGSLMLGLSPGRAFGLAALVLWVHIMAFGRRRLEQLAFLVLIVGTAFWLDILPSTGAVKGLIHALVQPQSN